MHRRVRLAPSVVVGFALLASATTVGAEEETDARIDANETTTVAALEAIRAAQERFKAAQVVDLDGDGVGEYGLMRELTRAMCARSDPKGATCGGHPDVELLDSTFLHPVMLRDGSQFEPAGEVSRSGYVFRIFLPNDVGYGIHEYWEGPLNSPVDTRLAETTWCCYAWPESYGETGRRTFFINQSGTIVSADFPRYTGKRPVGESLYPGAALSADEGIHAIFRITGTVAANAVGRDEGYWSLVDPRVRVSRVRVRLDRSRSSNDYDYDNIHKARRIKAFSIDAHVSSTSAVETMVVRAVRLRPGVRYAVNLLPKSWSPGDLSTGTTIGHGVASASGRLTLRFDSRRTLFPAGVTTLTDFARGWLTMSEERDPLHGHAIRIRLGEVEARDPARRDDVELAGNEAAAVATLGEIAAAQERFRATARADVNGDGVGEYGLFRELSGGYAVRTLANGTGAGTVLDPPLLPGAFGTFNRNNEVARSGYLFHMILPSWEDHGVVEIATGALATPIDSDLAETTWCCYAWPKEYGVTGKRTYFINQDGVVTTTKWPGYSGTGALGTAVIAGAAFRTGDSLTRITGEIAICSTGRDANRWRAVTERPDERASSVSGALTPAASDFAATGTFRIESTQSRTVTSESMALRVTGLDRTVAYRVVLTTEDGASRIAVGTTRSSDGASGVTSFDGEFCEPPSGMDSLRSFGGGTVELLDGDTVVLRGAIPRFATLTGPIDAAASLDYRAHVELAPGPNLRLKRGDLEVRATVDATGAHQAMTFSVTTFDRLAERAEVVAVAGEVETPIGTIRLAGDRGAGLLRLDTARGNVMPGGSLQTLAGQRIEVRDTTGAVLLTGTFPSVE